MVKEFRPRLDLPSAQDKEWSVEVNLKQAHTHAIKSIDSLSTLLFSASINCLKVWDLATMATVHEVKDSDQKLFSCLKAMNPA